jgi:Spy/CpxP family protein refolding chaperone
MHKVKAVLLLGVALGFSAACLSAQDQPGQAQPQGGGQHHKGGGQVNTDKMLARMTEKLNLSADQQAQLRPILADRQKQIQALRADSSLSEDDRRAKGKQIMQATNGQIEGILNDQQKQQWQQMKDERGEHHKGGHKHGADSN